MFQWRWQMTNVFFCKVRDHSEWINIWSTWLEPIFWLTWGTSLCQQTYTCTHVVYGKHSPFHRLAPFMLKIISRVPVLGRTFLENCIHCRNSDFHHSMEQIVHWYQYFNIWNLHGVIRHGHRYMCTYMYLGHLGMCWHPCINWCTCRTERVAVIFWMQKLHTCTCTCTCMPPSNEHQPIRRLLGDLHTCTCVYRLYFLPELITVYASTQSYECVSWPCGPTHLSVSHNL